MKPSVFDELYPGRFLKAGLLKGQKVTLTITDVDLEGLEDEEGKKKQKAIVSFQERPLQLVMCKTNGICIKAMFGAALSDWIGKRITLFESQWNGEPCIRIWGSPDIQADQSISVVLPRRRPIPMVMRALRPKNGAQAKPTPAQKEPVKSEIDPKVEEVFNLLAWNDEKRAEFLGQTSHLTTDEQVSLLQIEL